MMKAMISIKSREDRNQEIKCKNIGLYLKPQVEHAILREWLAYANLVKILPEDEDYWRSASRSAFVKKTAAGTDR